MPRYTQDREFRLGEYWLSRQARSDAWCRTWFDPHARQTRRRSLRTSDFEEAKQRLTDWFVLSHSKLEQAPKDILLAEVFARYFEQYGSKLRTAGNVRRYLTDWVEFHGDATIEYATKLDRQEAFRTYLKGERGLSPSTVRQALTIGKSALNWAWKRGEISAVPYIELVKVPRPAPKGRPMEIRELAKLLGAAEYHLQTFIVMMIATTGRTRAVLDLTFDRVDLSNNLIQLNPDDREQTQKYRPTVKLPESLKPWIIEHRASSSCPSVVQYRGAPVASIRSGWRTLRATLKMDNAVQPYGIRHTMARLLRKSSVPAWETAAQLGHKVPDVSTTEIYAPFDPAYLFKATAAIDAYFGALACELRVNSVSDFLIENLKIQQNQGGKWWFGGDLNSRPHDYESCALTS